MPSSTNRSNPIASKVVSATHTASSGNGHSGSEVREEAIASAIASSPALGALACSDAESEAEAELDSEPDELEESSILPTDPPSPPPQAGRKIQSANNAYKNFFIETPLDEN